MSRCGPGADCGVMLLPERLDGTPQMIPIDLHVPARGSIAAVARQGHQATHITRRGQPGNEASPRRRSRGLRVAQAVNHYTLESGPPGQPGEH